MCLQEKKLVAEIKKTAKTGNEVCSAPDRFVTDQLQYIWCGHNWWRNWQTQVLHFLHNRMNLAVLWSHVLFGCKALSVGKALWPVIAEAEIEHWSCLKAILDQFLAVINMAHSLRELFVHQVATKILAQQLIRLRQQIAKLQGSCAQIRGVATHTQVRGITEWSS